MGSKKTKLYPGLTFGQWTLIDKVVNSETGKQVGWNCRCSCGNVKLIKNMGTIVGGTSTSCGCFRSENLKVNNPMFNSHIAKNMSDNHKADLNRKKYLEKAHLTAWSDESKSKRINTNQERYGGSTPSVSTTVQNKTRATNQDRYGGAAPASSKTILRKMQDTTLERYGVENVMELDEFKEKVGASISKTRREKGIELLPNGQTLVDYCKATDQLATSVRNIRRKYGQAVLAAYVANPLDRSKSQLEQFFLDVFKKHGIDAKIHNRRAPVLLKTEYKYKPDFIINNNGKDLYVESDGLYYHDVAKKGKMYHFDKCDAYISQDSYVYQFRSDEILFKTAIVLSMIKGKLGHNSSIGARNCLIKDVGQSIADEFLTTSHLMGTITAKHIGLYYEEELVCLMSYKVFSGGELDITRFCTKLNTHVSGGFSRLLAHLENKTQCLMVKSFVDRRYATGESLIKCGFTLESITVGWQWSDKTHTFNRQYCMANMDERGLTEAQHAKELKLIKIYDAGQAKYIKVIKSI